MATPAPAPLDLKNVQGDILINGLPKKTETFFFFQIDKNRVHDFRTQLAQLVPLITTATQAIGDHKKINEHKKSGDKQLLKLSGVNVAFSHKGLTTIGINDELGEQDFNDGQLQRATKDFNDKTENWIPAFKQEIHGVILVTGDCHATVDEKLGEVKKIFKVDTPTASIHKVLSVVGDVRPGKEKGHEHFGYLDGVSQPAVKDVDTVINNGQETVRQGIILTGREGDDVKRPSWALDGSFLVFRYLSQLVPEFDAFKKEKAKTLGLDEELLGARLMGRWKSGAPINVSPFKDDPPLGADSTLNNDFSFNAVFPNDQKTQNRCPFAAHIRKTNPRADLESIGFPTETRRIIRSGIQFGPEVSPDEAAKGKTINDRGLLFVCYQSNITNGFHFIQQSWANTTNFPPKDNNFVSGFDPIIGQAPNEGPRTVTGADPKKPNDQLPLPVQWVLSRGGEYFFSPSIPALKQNLALAA